jgi:hypothetical protein
MASNTTTTTTTSVQNTEARNEFVNLLMELMEVIDELVEDNHMNEQAKIKISKKTKELYEDIEDKFKIVHTNIYYNTLVRVSGRNYNKGKQLDYSQKTTKGGYTPCNKCGRLIKDGGNWVGRGLDKRLNTFMEQHQSRQVCQNILGQKEGVHKTCGGAEEYTKNEVLTHHNNHIHTIAVEGMIKHKKRQKEKVKLWRQIEQNPHHYPDYQPDWIKDPDGHWIQLEYEEVTDSESDEEADEVDNWSELVNQGFNG